MKALKFASIFACCFLFLFLIGSAQSAEKQVVVNLMIDADVPPSPSEEQGYQTEAMLNAMLTEIEGNTLGATIISTQDVLATYTRMRITRIGANPNNAIRAIVSKNPLVKRSGAIGRRLKP